MRQSLLTTALFTLFIFSAFLVLLLFTVLPVAASTASLPANVLSSEAAILGELACGEDCFVAVIHHLFGRGDCTSD